MMNLNCLEDAAINFLNMIPYQNNGKRKYMNLKGLQFFRQERQLSLNNKNRIRSSALTDEHQK